MPGTVLGSGGKPNQIKPERAPALMLLIFRVPLGILPDLF